MIFSISTALTMLQSCGLVFEYMYAWGERTWGAGFSAQNWELWKREAWEFEKSDFLNAISALTAAFWHPKIVVASTIIVITIIFRSILEEASKLTWRRLSDSFYIFVSLASLLLFLNDFADEVYPNIKYNYGGGQPDIAELQIGMDKPAVVELPGINECCPEPGDTVTTDPVVVWYQSDKFLYLAPLAITDRRPVRLLAIDIKLVRTIRYLPMSIRVISGGHIVSIHKD